MYRQKLETVNDKVAVILTPTILDEMGIESDTEVEVSVVDGTLLIRPVPNLEATMQELLERRKRVYEALAKGHDDPTNDIP